MTGLSAAPAVAQYVPGSDLTVSWTLDPRDFPDLFPRGPAFGARSVQAGMDLDGDGLKEILFTTDETLAPEGPDPGVLDVYLYEATADNTYEYVWHYSHIPSNSLPALGHGDIDGDGLNEIYFGVPTINDDAEDLFVFEQDDSGVFPDEPTAVWGYDREGSADFRPAGFQIVDVDNDGTQELLTVSRRSGARELVVATVNGDLNAFATFSIEFEAGEAILGGGGVYDVDVADFDGDGLNEIWVNTWDNFSMAVWEATGADTYELQAELNGVNPVDDPGGFNSHDMLFDDVDGDGSLELFYPMTDGNLYFLDSLDDVSTLTFESFTTIGMFDATGSARGGAMGDIDGDGNVDIVASHGTAEIVSRIEYNGTGSYADSTSYTWSSLLESVGEPLDRYYPMTVTDDLDGDGLNEVVLTNLFASSPGQPMIIVVEAQAEATSTDDVAELPGAYILRQNYPNPFNPSTSISYVLPQADVVSVRVYNVMGQLVRTLVDGQASSPGSYEVQWNGRNDAGQLVSSGVYLYALETSQQRQTRRMTLLK
ncbi:MAG: FlgD immunoglobulin-like domain containing protein [Bacteroidota bacterium]